jgi:hypothetical protein
MFILNPSPNPSRRPFGRHCKEEYFINGLAELNKIKTAATLRYLLQTTSADARPLLIGFSKHLRLAEY